MRMLTVVITGPKSESVRCRESFLPLAQWTEFMHFDGLETGVEVGSKWKMFMYVNERLDVALQATLIHYLASNGHDYFTFRRKPAIDQSDHILFAPRLFRAHVELKPDGIYPLNIDTLRGELVLDGFIEGIW